MLDHMISLIILYWRCGARAFAGAPLLLALALTRCGDLESIPLLALPFRVGLRTACHFLGMLCSIRLMPMASRAKQMFPTRARCRPLSDPEAAASRATDDASDRSRVPPSLCGPEAAALFSQPPRDGLSNRSGCGSHGHAGVGTSLRCS